MKTVCIHNDLCFQNVKFASSGKDEIVLVVDFDLCQAGYRAGEFNNMVWALPGHLPLFFNPKNCCALLHGYCSTLQPECSEGELICIVQTIRSRVLEEVVRHQCRLYPPAILEEPSFAAQTAQRWELFHSFAQSLVALRSWHSPTPAAIPTPTPTCQALRDTVKPSDLPAAILTQKYCSMDPALAEELAALVRSGIGDVPDLANLHTLPEGASEPSGQHLGQDKHGRTNIFSRRWGQAIVRPAFRARLDAWVRKFVAESFSAAVDAEQNGWDHFVYQKEPSLRIHMPFTRCLGIAHTDYDYHHQPNEVNVWIPLVPRVSGSNSLYCESAPGKGDFSPFDVSFGSFVRFWGNQCTHFSKVNETDVTRVSMDLRVIPVPSAMSGSKALFDPEWKSPKKPGWVAFRLGNYYKSTADPLDSSKVDEF